MTFRSYLKLLACLTLVGSIVILGVNWIVDPFYIFATPKIDGVNALKTGYFKHLRVMKPLALEAQKHAFDAVVLGSSRAEAGLDPENPAWGTLTVYNLGIPAASVYELMRYYEFAEHYQNFKTVVLALDFSQFRNGAQFKSNYEVDRLLNSLHAGHERYPVRALAATLFSVDAVLASGRTVLTQRHPRVEHSPKGFGIHRWRQLKVAEVGYRSTFLENDKQYIFDHWAQPEPTAFALDQSASSASALASLRELVGKCRANGAHLVVLVSPSHAREWSAIWASGLWPQVEQWKRDLVRILAEDAARHLEKEPFVLWDFGGYNTVTTEEVPQPGDTNSQMRWYWEASHYKKEVGDMMLAKLFDYHNPELPVPDDFGVKLTPDNIDEHQQTMRERQSVWHQQHKQDIEEIVELVNLTRRERLPKGDKV